MPRDEALKAIYAYLEIIDFRFPRLLFAKVRAGIEAECAPRGDDAAYTRALSQNPGPQSRGKLAVALGLRSQWSYCRRRGTCTLTFRSDINDMPSCRHRVAKTGEVQRSPSALYMQD